LVRVNQSNSIELSSSGNTHASSYSSFLSNHKWEPNKVRILYNNNAKESGVQRIAFVNYSASSKDSDVTEYVHYQQQFELDDQQQQQEQIDKQNRARDAAFAAIQALYNDDRDSTLQVLVDDFDGCPQQAAEGVYLASHQFALDEKKRQELKVAQLSLLNESAGTDLWNRGKILAESQNWAKLLQELPANYCTPSLFCDLVTKEFQNTKVQVQVHDKEWAQEHEMNSFLSVSSGSDEPPKVLELRFINNPNKKEDEYDIAFVGKGVTFDSGGLSVKGASGMKLMKADQGGACTTVAVLKAIAELDVKLNVLVVNMMTENMINGKATRPGDVVTASNGKTIEVDNTDAEGRLALADGLVYASKLKPTYLIDIATLTGAIGIALSDACTGLFTNSNKAWKLFEEAGYTENDPMWRMPLFRTAYKKQLKALSADLNNIGGRPGGAATAATFLAEFVDFENVPHWVHLDIAEVVIPEVKGECGTGRPVRSIVRFGELLQKQ
jgi:aminopeptidase